MKKQGGKSATKVAKKVKGKAAKSGSHARQARNPQLLPDKDVTLTGAERFHIANSIEKISAGQRTQLEKRLLGKVR